MSLKSHKQRLWRREIIIDFTLIGYIKKKLEEKICETVCWHVYGKSVWHRPSFDDKLFAEKETYKLAILQDKFAVAWKKKDRFKLVHDTVGHVPREISRAVWYFIDLGGSVKGRVFDQKFHPSPIPRGGLEIILMVKSRKIGVF